MAIVEAQSYGDALFQLALEEDRLDAYKEQLEVIIAQLHEHPQFLKVMTHPKINKEEKKETLQQIFQDSMDVMVVNFLKLLIDKNRFGSIFDIVKDFTCRYNQHNDIQVAYIYSARKLTKVQEKQVRTMLEKKLSKKVDIRLYEDPSLIAGIRIKLNDLVIDYSALNQLQILKQKARSMTSPQES